MTWRTRLARGYHLLCAREDVRRNGLTVPVGVWLCEHCQRWSFDQALLLNHVAMTH
jgi:ribosomal protein L37AE/L43A